MVHSRVADARWAAFDVLRAVETGGFASELLRGRTRSLDSRDAGLASEIVFGVLRRQSQLDWLIGRQGRRPVNELDQAVRLALRIGAYQLRHLDRVPAHAVVNDSVEIVKRASAPKAAGFVNAILRRLPAGEIQWPNRATALAMPEWLLARWERAYGRDAAEGIARMALKEPAVYVRVVEPPAGPLAEDLAATGVPGAYEASGAIPPGARRMDVGSQSIVPLLDLQPGQRFLDLCAAPGNKTAHALEYGVVAIACDVNVSRLAPLRDLPCQRVALDATGPLPFRRKFDRILVDAPCSGTGTLGRNPEIKWRLQPEKLRELHQLQVAILTQALNALESAGRLVYSTCSLEREENEDVLEAVSPGVIGAIHRRIPGREEGDGFFAAVLPPL